MTTEKTMAAWARRLTREAPVWIDQEDLQQEGRIAVWQGRWAWSAMIDALRATKRMKRARTNQGQQDGYKGLEILIADMKDEDEGPSAESRLDAQRLWEWLCEMSPDILLPLFLGLSHRDIAAHLGVTPGRITQRQDQDRLAIQARLQGTWKTEHGLILN